MHHKSLFASLLLSVCLCLCFVVNLGVHMQVPVRACTCVFVCMTSSTSALMELHHAAFTQSHTVWQCVSSPLSCCSCPIFIIHQKSSSPFNKTDVFYVPASIICCSSCLGRSAVMCSSNNMSQGVAQQEPCSVALCSA